MADVTSCQHNETGHFADIPTDALAAYQKLGWQPVGASRSQEQAEQDRIDEANAAAAHLAEVTVQLAGDLAPEASKPANVADVLDQVGEDPDAARVALDLEAARPNPRTTLVDGLQKIIDAAAPVDGTNQEG